MHIALAGGPRARLSEERFSNQKPHTWGLSRKLWGGGRVSVTGLKYSIVVLNDDTEARVGRNTGLAAAFAGQA